MKKYILLSVITYLVGVFFALFVKIDNNFGTSDLQRIDAFYSAFEHRTKSETLNLILKNNLNVILINFIGIFSFGFLAFANTAYNGFTLAYVIRTTSNSIPLTQLFFTILPHSIELVGLLLSTAVSFYCGVFFFSYCFKDGQSNSFKGKETCYLATASLLLTTIAGFIEVYVSMD